MFEAVEILSRRASYGDEAVSACMEWLEEVEDFQKSMLLQFM